jgi:hypothetical protein
MLIRLSLVAAGLLSTFNVKAQSSSPETHNETPYFYMKIDGAPEQDGPKGTVVVEIGPPRTIFTVQTTKEIFSLSVKKKQLAAEIESCFQHNKPNQGMLRTFAKDVHAKRENAFAKCQEDSNAWPSTRKTALHMGAWNHLTVRSEVTIPCDDKTSEEGQSEFMSAFIDDLGKLTLEVTVEGKHRILTTSEPLPVLRVIKHQSSRNDFGESDPEEDLLQEVMLLTPNGQTDKIILRNKEENEIDTAYSIDRAAYTTCLRGVLNKLKQPEASSKPTTGNK